MYINAQKRTSILCYFVLLLPAVIVLLLLCIVCYIQSCNDQIIDYSSFDILLLLLLLLSVLYAIVWFQLV